MSLAPQPGCRVIASSYQGTVSPRALLPKPRQGAGRSGALLPTAPLSAHPAPAPAPAPHLTATRAGTVGLPSAQVLSQTWAVESPLQLCSPLQSKGRAPGYLNCSIQPCQTGTVQCVPPGSHSTCANHLCGSCVPASGGQSRGLFFAVSPAAVPEPRLGGSPPPGGCSGQGSGQPG